MNPQERCTSPACVTHAGGAPRAAGASGGAFGACQTSNKQVGENGPEPSVFAVLRHEARLRRMRKAVLIGTAEHQANLPAGFRCRPLFVTLTYRDGVRWRPGHISDCLTWLRDWLRARNGGLLRVQWVAELTKRGRVHYHLIVWWPARLLMPNLDDIGAWPHGLSSVQRARNPAAYLAKYASKGTPGGLSFPKGIRMHGCRGLELGARRRRSWLLRPGWLRSLTTPDTRLVAMVGGGWLDVGAGRVLLSPWEVVLHSPDWGSVWLRRRESVTPPMEKTCLY